MDDTAESLRNWVAKASSYFSAFWAEATGFSAQLTLGSIVTETYGTLLSQISKEDMACVTELGEVSSTQWYSSPKQLRGFVGEMLAMGEEEVAALEGPLSSIEESLVGLCFESLATAFTDAWMGPEPLPLQSGDLVQDPRKSRLFRAKDLVTRVQIEFQLKAASLEVSWLLPKQKTSDLLEAALDRRAAPEKTSVPESTVRQVPIDVVTSLGQVSVPMSQLSDLKEGQLIMLDQRIDQPITAFVNDRPFYECWPGKLGGQQALQVINVLHGSS